MNDDPTIQMLREQNELIRASTKVEVVIFILLALFMVVEGIVWIRNMRKRGY